MSFKLQFIQLLTFSLLVVLAGCKPSTLSQEVTKGFVDYGVTTNGSNQRGIIATKDGEGRNVVLVWLYDYRGCYEMLMIDAETGKSEEFPLPFPVGDAVYSSLLSTKNKYYTLFNSYFSEFDPVKRSFSFSKKTLPMNTMGMTEDDKGVIWAATYPGSGLVSFNPVTREFKDYGYVYKQNWNQYPGSLAADDSGYIYFGIGNTASQIIAFDPLSGKATPMLNESERKRGTAYVYRDLDGKVYGQFLKGSSTDWYELYKGIVRNIGTHPVVNAKPVITGNQNLFYSSFPDGKKIKKLDLLERKLVIEDPKNSTTREVKFNYASQGGWTMGVAASPDGRIVGGTSFPMRFFSFNPKTNSWTNLPAYGQFNALTKQGDCMYFGSYPGGVLLEWNPSSPWVDTKKGAQTNPQLLAEVTPVIHRPHRVLALPDGKTIVMSGTPEYGYTGGGLLFWDRVKKSYTLIKDSAVVLDQSTMSMVALPGGKILGGTTTAPGTGGEKKANNAELYIMDIASKHLDWHKIVIPGVQDFSDMCLAPDGMVYGIADYKIFFVFDPVSRTIVYQQDQLAVLGKTIASQSPRIFVQSPDREIYLLFAKGIAKVDPLSYKLSLIALYPLPITAGGDYLDGYIYFISGSHLCSYKL
jgi:streptogramin lyase